MRPLWRYFDERAREPGRLRGGLVALVAIGLAYAACILLLAVGGARPNPAPWLRISPATYFYWEAAFIAPVIVLGGLLAAAVMHLLARGAGGRGSFDDTLALAGTAIALCTMTTVVPDTVVGLLLCGRIVTAQGWMQAITHPTAVLTVIWMYLVVYVIAFLVCFPAVVAAVHGLRLRTAFVIGATGFVVYQGFLFVFVR